MSEVINLDLVDAFKQAFGIQPKSYDLQVAAVQGDTPLSRKEKGQLGSPYYAIDKVLGVEYFMPVTISYPDVSQTGLTDTQTLYLNGQAISNSGALNSGLIKSFDLPVPVISIDARNTIVKTGLTERTGTVKELISADDYDITIHGFIISATDDYPEETVATMAEIFRVGQAVSIRSVLTDIFLLHPDRSGSDQAVVTDFKLTGLKGRKNQEAYELRLVSDAPFSLIDIRQ